MIARITGTLVDGNFTEVIVDVNGVGYRIFIPMSTYDKLPKTGENVSLLTHLHVREDALNLFGFATPEEQELFEMLIGVSGIGARLALSILSSMPVGSFCNAIINGDLTLVKRINGIGKKTAERLIIELKDKVAKSALSAPGDSEKLPDTKAQAVEDALLALAQLGFKAESARKVVHGIAEKLAEKDCSPENLIRKSLQSLNQ